MSKRKIILVQLPIPPVGPEPIRGNVPLAAGYLRLFARLRGLESHYDIDIFPTFAANSSPPRRSGWIAASQPRPRRRSSGKRIATCVAIAA